MDILQMSRSAAVMIAAVTVIRALTLHRLPKRTFLALWGAVVCRLLLPFDLPSRLSLYTGLGRLRQLLLTPAEETAAPFAALTEGTDKAGAAFGGEAFQGMVSPAAPATAVSPLLILWLVGLCACALFFIIAYLRCRREFKTSLPVQNEFAARWLRERAPLRAVRLRQSDRVRAPLTYGVLRPVILLPKCTDWTDEAGLRAILTHELTHVRRFDTLTKLVLAAAVSVHWFNPLVWAMYVLANRDLELSCDEAVVRALGEKEKSAYALTLIRLAERKSGLAPLVSGFAGNAIEERITAIMKIKKRSVIGSVLALILVVGTVTVFATGAADETGAATASEALGQLAESVVYADGELSFQIPESYPDVKNWNILISGRTEQDGFGRSVHYLTEENESQSWQAGKRYIIPLTEAPESYTELWLTASLPDSAGAIEERTITLAVLSAPASSEAGAPAASPADYVEASTVSDAEDTGWVWPVEGCDTVTAAFGKRLHPISGTTTENDHITIGGDNAAGARVYAALAGTVSETGFYVDLGNYIRITHANGIETVYAHLQEVSVKDGDTVAAGGTIGTVGQTGSATGPCLAFYVYADGEAANPLEYYK